MNQIMTRTAPIALCTLLVASAAWAGGACEPSWDATLGVPGATGEIYSSSIGLSGNLVVGGAFPTMGGQPISRLASWDGAQWSSLGSGPSDDVRALARFQGSLYAGGDFNSAGGQSAARVARWDGAQWLTLGAGVDASVHALGVSSVDGSEALYVGGLFANANGVSAKRIAKWDGVGWAPLGSGVTIPGEPSVVYAICEFDLGEGPLLAVGGVFTVAGGQFANNVAVWDGASWSPLGGGVDGAVRCFEVFDDGTGPALYVGGDFETAGAIPSKRVARWNGQAWSSVGNGGSWGFGSRVRELRVFDEGDGERLIAAGEFLIADGASVGHLAAWDGAQWSNAFGGVNQKVGAMTVVDSETLLIGGAFSTAGGVGANSVAIRTGCAAPSIPGDLNGDGVVDTADLGVLILNFGTMNAVADVNQDGIVDTADLGILIANFGS